MSREKILEMAQDIAFRNQIKAIVAGVVEKLAKALDESMNELDKLKKLCEGREMICVEELDKTLAEFEKHDNQLIKALIAMVRMSIQAHLAERRALESLSM